ncbi:MAG: histone deacetylase [Bacteroidota bacterium]
MNETLLFWEPSLLEHDPGAGHPESPSRLARIVTALQANPVAGTSWRTPRPATTDELIAVHPRAHIDFLETFDGRHACLDGDTMLSPGSWRAAGLAAGAAAQAVEEVWTGRAANAFALIRPPGHHAEASRAMGFCLLNNAAVGAETALRLGARRVAILDWDVHHGNGTQHLFDDRPDVLYLSAHQFPLYPGTGAADEIGQGAGSGLTVNCALPPDQGDADYGAVFHDVFLPALDAFAPDLLIVSAGFDAHARDPLGQMRVTEDGFAAMCSRVADAVPKLVLLLEGGYDLAALAASARACVEVLAGAREEFPSGVGPRAAEAIAASQGAHAHAGRRLFK